MQDITLKKIESLNSLEEIEGWRWCINILRLREMEQGEAQALLHRELQLKLKKIRGTK